jgi:hypothetical protein
MITTMTAIQGPGDSSCRGRVRDGTTGGISAARFMR